jgi:uncharacterized membrane protein YphA (DoxX/SURF4 family)
VALRILAWICRLGLGVVFVAAGYTKLKSPFLFEMAVDAYRILPPFGVIVVARSLPWLEIVLGLLLLAGWKLRYFSSFAALLVGFFVGVMAYTFSRGVEANCGCFGFGEKISPLTLARDSVFLALAVFLAVYSWIDWKKKSVFPSPQLED